MSETKMTQRKNIDLKIIVLEAVDRIAVEERRNGKKDAKNLIEALCEEYAISKGELKRTKKGELVRA